MDTLLILGGVWQERGGGGVFEGGGGRTDTPMHTMQIV